MKKFLLAALALAGLATACRKDDDVVCLTAPSASLDTFTKRYAPKVQVFEFDPTQPRTIRTVGNATVTIAANIFIRTDGTLPTGPVKLLFQELYDPAEMLLANMPTMTWGNILESGGEFNIRVMEGATRLRLTSQAQRSGGLVLRTDVPARVSPDTRTRMLLWARESSSDPDSAFWIPATIDSANGRQDFIQVGLVDSTGRPSSYVGTQWPDTLGWLNHDAYPYTTAPRVSVQVAVEGGLANTRIFLVPADLNGVFRPFWDAWQAPPVAVQPNLPLGADLTAVILRIKDGKYYFGTHRAPAADGFVYRPVLEEVSEDELVRRIRQL